MWFKYYVFQNIVKIGFFDKEKNKFTKRTDSTVKPFIEINREAIAMLYDELYKYLNEQEITDKALQQLIQNGSFNKIYAYIIRKLDKVKKSNSNNNEGIWKKYEQESDPNILFNDIHGKGTGWCTAGGLETAKSHLDVGDFYVYYTKDENDKYTNPRIAIRMEWSSIAEIRGVAEQQNLESEMESVVEEKLNEFPDKEEYKKKVSDMKELTKIYNKCKNKEELTKNELIFLYEINSKIIGFGYEKDPRIHIILEDRNIKEDLTIALDLSEDEISFTEEDALKRNVKYHHWDLDLEKLTSAKGLKLPKIIRGNLFLENLTDAEGLILPEIVGEKLNLESLTSVESLILPKKIGDGLCLDNLITAKGLVFPEEVEGYLDLRSLTSAENLILPKKIGSLDLRSLTSTEGLVLPEKIDSLDLSGLSSAKGLVLPKVINGRLNLNGLTSAEGLILPEKIGGDLCLGNLTRAENLILPKEVGGELNLSSLISIEDLILPKKIGSLDLRSLTSAEGLVLPETVNRRLNLGNLVKAKKLILPRKINSSLDLDSLISVKYLVLPEKIGTYIDLSKAIIVKNIILPKNCQGEFYVPGTLFSIISKEKLIKIAKRTEKRQIRKNKIKTKILSRRK